MFREKSHFRVSYLSLQLVFFSFFLSLLFPKYSFAQVTRWSSDSAVNTSFATSSVSEVYPQFINTSDGGFFLTWQNFYNGAIYINKIDKEGNKIWNQDKLVGNTLDRFAAVKIVAGNNNDVYLVWAGFDSAGKGRIFGQRIDGDGNLLWGSSAKILSDPVDDHVREPVATIDNHGGLVISWTSYSSSIWAQRIDENGNKLWGVMGVRLSNDGYLRRLSEIASDGSGGAYVVWSSGGLPIELRGQRVNENGQTQWGSNGKLIGTNISSAVHYKTVLAKDGNVVLIWVQREDSGEKNYIQKLDASGSLLWGSPGKLLNINIGGYPQLLADSDGGAYIVWIFGTGISQDIYAQRFSADGNRLWEEQWLSIVQKEGVQSPGRALVVEDGNLLVSWTDYNVPGGTGLTTSPESNILAQKISADGSFFWNEEGVVISNARSTQVGGSLAVLDGDSYVIAWTDFRNSNLDIFAQRVNSDGTLGSSQPSPTPTPIPCVLQNFGDASGNPLRQKDDQWKDKAYGGSIFTKSDGTTIFLPYAEDDDRDGRIDEDPRNGINDDGDGRMDEDTPETIGKWGCTITSASMIVNYFAHQQGVNFETNPDLLNTWLQNNQGYSVGKALPNRSDPQRVTQSTLWYEKVSEYAKENGITLSTSFIRNLAKDQTQSNFVEETKDQLNDSLCAFNPVIMAVDGRYGSHYIDAAGKLLENQIDTWKIFDPESFNVNSLNTLYQNRYKQLIGYHDSPLTKKLAIVSFSDPVHLLLIDPQGRKTGFDSETGTSFDQIPSSSYGLETLASDEEFSAIQEARSLYVDNPIDGTFVLKVTGEVTERYSIETLSINEQGESSVLSVTDISAPQTTTTFFLNYNAAESNSASITRQLDIDIKPHGKYNFVNPNSNDAVQVAILGTPTFDATKVDFASVVFGSNKVQSFKKVPLVTDVDKDGDQDYLVYFKNRGSGIVAGDTEVCMTGQTTDFIPVPFKGCGAIQTLPQ